MTLKVPRLTLVERIASDVLREFGIVKLKVDPFAIADAKEILVQGKSHDGISGMLARHGETYGILYSTYIDNDGFQRFSVSHELGHYFIPDHVGQVLKDGKHVSIAGFTSPDPYEQEADFFAASLLMPSNLVRPLMNRTEDGLDIVEVLADECGVSRTAAAIRYAGLTRGAVAVVLATDGVVDFATFSDAMKDAKVRWLRRGSPVPSGSMTAQLAADRSGVLNGRREVAEVNLVEWFECPKSHCVKEDVIGLGKYGKTLTVIHSGRLSAAAEGLDDEEDEEERMEDSWTPRFRR